MFIGSPPKEKLKLIFKGRGAVDPEAGVHIQVSTARKGGLSGVLKQCRSLHIRTSATCSMRAAKFSTTSSATRRRFKTTRTRSTACRCASPTLFCSEHVFGGNLQRSSVEKFSGELLLCEC